MAKAVVIIAGVVVAALVVLLLIAATKPNIFRVQRSTSIKAPPEKIFAILNDFHQWGVWSPYEHKDPAMTRAFAGAPSGVGAHYAWAGKNAGTGSMDITESVPSSRIALNLDFTKPFKAHNVVVFSLEPEGGATKVTWAMSGPASLMSKVMGTLIDMDKMVGKDFETGLATLKTVTE